MRRLLTAMAMVASMAGSVAATGSEVAVPQLVTQICAACHGLDGNGTNPPTPTNPKLSGFNASYISKQLRDFQSGLRPSDFMAPWVVDMEAGTVSELAGYFAAQIRTIEPPRHTELLDYGREIYINGIPDSGVPSCSGCHQEDGRGNPRFPLLAGQYAEYTLNEMRLFAGGIRDNDRGLVMQSVALRMNEEEMRAVSEYLMSMQ